MTNEESGCYYFSRELLSQSSLALVRLGSQAFRADRPTLSIAHERIPEQTFHLLWGEIEELNGSDKYGYFADVSRRSEYRHQELADVLIFLQDVLNAISLEFGEELAIDEAGVEQQAAALAEASRVSLVSHLGHNNEKKDLTAHEEKTFKHFRDQLNYEARLLNPENQEEWKALNPAEKMAILETVVAHVYVLFGILGRHPVKSSMEKIARNNLRYPPSLLQDRYEDILNDPSLTDEMKNKAIAERYDKAIEACKSQFDGPAVVSGPNKGKRGQFGTRRFYSPAEVVDVDEPKELGGDWYEAYQAWLMLQVFEDDDRVAEIVYSDLIGNLSEAGLREFQVKRINPGREVLIFAGAAD